MEENRLKPMVEHDPKVFNSIYKDTEQLRRKLAYGIDARRFGVDYEEVLSWFDVKFIHSFNRYYGQKPEGVLKAYIINSLQFFKQRILRFSYSQKAQIHNTVDIEDLSVKPECVMVDFEYQEHQTLLKYALGYIRPRVNCDTFQVLEVELNPPMYILGKLQDKNTTKIPSNLIADYLGWGSESDGVRRVNLCRKELKQILPTVKEHFQVASI